MRTRLLKVDPRDPDPAAIKEAAVLLRRGGLVAFPTETVYGLGANLDDPQAIQELYQVKQRPFEKQATLHLGSAEQVEQHGVVVPPLGRRLMQKFWPGPLTLIFARPDGSTLGFRVPEHPVALALLKAAAVPVVASSANLSGEPAPRTAEEVFRSFNDRIDLILDAGSAPIGVSSTVLDLTADPPRFLREGTLVPELKKFLHEQN